MRIFLTLIAAFCVTAAPVFAQATFTSSNNIGDIDDDSFEMPDPRGYIPNDPYAQVPYNVMQQQMMMQQQAMTPEQQQLMLEQQQGFSKKEDNPRKQIYRGAQQDKLEAPRVHRMYEPTRY